MLLIMVTYDLERDGCWLGWGFWCLLVYSAFCMHILLLSMGILKGQGHSKGIS